MGAGELGGVKFRGDGDQSMGERLMEVALGLMREVKAEVQAVNLKLDDIAKERREEAREAGEISSRVRTLEQALPRDARTRLETLERRHRASAGVAYSVAGAMIMGLLIWVLKMALAHPETIYNR